MTHATSNQAAHDAAHPQPSAGRRRFLKAAAAAGASAALPLLSGRASAASHLSGRHMVHTTWGGVYRDAQVAAYCDPFSAATGAEVIQGGPMNAAKLSAMLKSGKPIWDVVDVVDVSLAVDSRKGYFEKIDTAVVNMSEIEAEYVHDYGVANIVWSYNIGYNTDAFPTGRHPRSWADVFDVAKFPGKRTLRDRVFPSLEHALLADGVKMQDLYPLDVDRAFAKLDTIKDDLILWKSNSESQQLFGDGVVGCGLILNGRAFDSHKKGAPVAIEWNQNIRSVDYYVIPKGAPNADVAMQFMTHVTRAENQARMANRLAYAPTNLDAFAMIDEEVKPWLSTHPDNAARGILISIDYWRDNLEALTKRWTEWKLS
ncbi:MAG: polyamine ABC transporter substrate-binding protein [Gammaproteobacteria bacterium]|nr:polyamine ABC transporter substrate-binding protein [Gammaproteobacteria bacterium]